MTENDLPPAELDVMSCLWRLGPSTASRIRQALEKQRPMAHATVCTLLKRLQDKGCVSREKSGEGKSFRYTARMQPSKAGRDLLGRILDRVFAGNRLAMVTEFLDSNDLSSDDIEGLESLLEELRQRRGKKKKKATRGRRRP